MFTKILIVVFWIALQFPIETWKVDAWLRCAPKMRVSRMSSINIYIGDDFRNELLSSNASGQCSHPVRLAADHGTRHHRLA